MREAEGRRAGSAEEELGRIRVQSSCVSHGGENNPLFFLTALSLHRDSRICGLGAWKNQRTWGAWLQRALLGGTAALGREEGRVSVPLSLREPCSEGPCLGLMLSSWFIVLRFLKLFKKGCAFILPWALQVMHQAEGLGLYSADVKEVVSAVRMGGFGESRGPERAAKARGRSPGAASRVGLRGSLRTPGVEPQSGRAAGEHRGQVLGGAAGQSWPGRQCVGGAPPEREGQASRGDMFRKAWGLPVGTALISPRSPPRSTS